MAHGELVFSSIASSNIPHREKSAIRRWYEKVSGGGITHRAKGHIMETGHALRQGGESLLVGGILGAAHASMKNGLDYEVKGGHVPADAVVGVVGMVGGVVMANDGVGADLRNAGAAGLTVFAFRKTNELVARKNMQGGAAAGKTLKAAGDSDVDIGEDPIVAAAKEL